MKVRFDGYSKIHDDREALNAIIAMAASSGDETPHQRARDLVVLAGLCDKMLRDRGVDDAFERMKAEYDRALEKHGTGKVLTSTTMADGMKLFALVEEIGEVARCLTYDKEHAGDIVEELVQVGGLSLAWACALDSKE